MANIVCKQKKNQYFSLLPKCPKTLFSFCVVSVKKAPTSVRSCKNVHLTKNGKVSVKKPKRTTSNGRKKSVR